MLRDHGVMPSVSRPGRPYDNGHCERFFRTLKQEEIGTKQYKDLEDLRHNFGDFIDPYYNQQRLHSALGYLSPAEFERITVSSEAASMASIVQVKT
jgi:transposase InsO family protein